VAQLEGKAPLTVEILRRSDHPVVQIGGELDLTNVDGVEAIINPLLESTPSGLTFDIASLTFMDSTGIALLIRAAARATVTLAHPSEVIRQIVQSTGLSGLIQLEP
jgi:anti-sigma B factor antagonist